MCGRYALVLRPPTLRRRLREYGLPVTDPGSGTLDSDHASRRSSGESKDQEHKSKRKHAGDESNDSGTTEHLDASHTEEDTEGTMPSYNIAPGYIEPVYRAVVYHGDEHTAPEGEENGKASGGDTVKYVVQGMKWGLVPSWTNRNPDYRSMLKTINCRDDSLMHNSGMWNSMKKKKRCVVLAEGFYEWQKKGKEKIPYYVKRKSGNLMFLAGLWDCVTLPDPDSGEPKRLYTYTIITVPSSAQLEFLHDRMPAILTTPEEVRTWLDPNITTWTPELQNLLRPCPETLEIYPVPKEVGKVGNNDKSFVLPLHSEENKSNIKNWFSDKGKHGKVKKENTEGKADTSQPKAPKEHEGKREKAAKGVKKEEEEQLPDTEQAPDAVPTSPTRLSVTRKRPRVERSPHQGKEGPPSQEQKPPSSPTHSRKRSVSSPAKTQHNLRSSTTNQKPTGKGVGNKTKKKEVSRDGSKKITNFFPK